MPYGERAIFLKKSESDYLQEGFQNFISVFPPTVVCRVKRGGGTLVVQSTVQGKDASELYEKIQVWEEEGVVVIWSCNDNPNLTDHDAAVLILTEAENFSTERVNSTLEKVKRVAKSYISDLLFNSIQWDQLNLSSQFTIRPTPIAISTCLVGEKKDWWEWFWVICPLVIWIILGRLFCGPGHGSEQVTQAVVNINITPIIE